MVLAHKEKVFLDRMDEMLLIDIAMNFMHRMDASIFSFFSFFNFQIILF
jgi:hypothetical protein